MMILMEIMQL